MESHGPRQRNPQPRVRFNEGWYKWLYRIACADEALVVLRRGINVSVVFSDVRLPGSMDGIALAQLVRSELPAVKIILASGHHPGLSSAEHDGFFAKPYDADRVIVCIRKLTR